MRHVLLAVLVILVVPVMGDAKANPQTQSKDTARDEEGINKTLSEFTDAWNKHDARAFSMIFAEDADFTNVRGTSAHGRTEIERFHAPLFATRFKDTHQKFTRVKIRFIRPDVAAVDVNWEMTGARGPEGQEVGLRKGLLSVVMAKWDMRWLILVMHNMDLPVSP